MKNLSIVLNVVLLIAVGVLYFLHFTQKNIQNETTGPVLNNNAVIKGIAYVNSDTLLENYAYFQDQTETLENKRKKLEAEFTNRAKGLENEIGNFQKNAQNMTMAQARAVEEDLMQKRQNLMQYQQNLQQELAEDQMEVNNKLYDQVSDYLKSYGKQRSFQIVLTYTKGSGVLYANDSLDITREVIKGLNEEYAKETANADTAAVK